MGTQNSTDLHVDRQSAFADASLVRNPNLQAIWGDSRAQNYSTYGSDRLGSKSAQHPVAWAQALLGQRFRVVVNAGRAGERSDQITANPYFANPAVNNVDAVLQSAAGIVHVIVGVNDIAQGFTADQIWAGQLPLAAAPLPSTLLRFVEAGIRPIIYSEAGSVSPGFTQAMVNEVHRLNEKYRRFCEENALAVYFDTGRVIWDTTVSAPASSPYLPWKAGFPDAAGPHWIIAGGFALGARLADVLRPLTPERPRLVRSGSEVPANGRVQFTTTPLLLPAGTSPVGGNFPTYGGDFTYVGTFPAGISFVRGLNGANDGSGAAKCTITCAPDPNGFGNVITLASTFTQNKEHVQVGFPCDISSGVAVGDTLFGSAHLEIAAGNTNSAIGFLAAGANGGNRLNNDLFGDPTGNLGLGPWPAGPFSLDSETGPHVVTTLGAGTVRLRVSGTGAGSMTASISRVGLQK